MFKKRFDYKGYNVWKTYDHIVMLYVPNAEIGTTYHALSFDDGKTWCIGNNQKIANNQFEGTFTEAIDMCVKLNEELQNEKQ